VTEVLPIVILALLLVVGIAFTRRNKQRSEAADLRRRQDLHPGSEVMTTSGLYGTVTSINSEEDSVQLAIAPGVEVKWTIAALRGVTELPPKYREAIDGEAGSGS
jgi:preprotein translocase subunit YajC